MNLVIDANILVALSVPLPYSEYANKKIQQWIKEKQILWSPWHIEYEFTSTLRKLIKIKHLTSEEAKQALALLNTINVNKVVPSLEDHICALAWAEKLDQGAAYDSYYLALTEYLEGQFWTADKRLVNRAAQINCSFVHWIGEN